jgi:2-phosphosulfolactate phosphatase
MDMDVEVFLTGAGVREEDVAERTVIVIDVLRACSTIITALQNGARCVIPVADMAQAWKITSNLEKSGFVLGGERNAEKIEGYDLGNSPTGYDQAAVKGKTVILNTTNGTGAFVRAEAAPELVAGSFLNAQAVVDFLAARSDSDVAIICAGWKNRVSLEDTLCAGLILHRVWAGGLPSPLNDSARIALALFRQHISDLHGAVRMSNHARRLSALGMEDDIDVCMAIDSIPLVPRFIDNKLIA